MFTNQMPDLFIIVQVQLFCVDRLVERPGVCAVFLTEHLLDDLVAGLHGFRHPVLGLGGVLGQSVGQLLQRLLYLPWAG